MDEIPRSDHAGGSAPDAAVPPRLLQDLRRLGAAFKHLFGAQWRLFVAELGLARGAISLLLSAGLAATVAGVGLGLTVLALIGVALAQWLGSWLWALLILAALQGIFLVVAIMLFRRGLHWLTLPATRGEFGAMMRDTVAKVREPMPPVPQPTPSQDRQESP